MVLSFVNRSKCASKSEFLYDASGNRILKKAIPPASSSSPITYTWYLRDASGNIMATETHDGTPPNWEVGKIDLHAEYPLYGSSRVGVKNYDLKIHEDGGNYIVTDNNVIENNFTRELNLKNYDLSNHLGNVLVTISDRKIGHDGGSGIADYYLADVTSAQDYYPFGMVMPGRSFGTPEYRFGFNGKEKDDEASGTGNQYDYGFRIYNPRIAKFLSVDPLTKDYPGWAPFAFAMNRVIQGIDLDGLEFLDYKGFLYLRGIPIKNKTEDEIRANNLPAYYKILGVNNKESFVTAYKDLELQLSRTTSPSQEVKTPTGAANGLAKNVVKLYVKHTIQGKTMEETKKQASYMVTSKAIVDAALSSGLIPTEFTDAQSRADLVNYIFDGTLPNANGEKDIAYNGVIEYLGAELFNNRTAVIQGTYERQFNNVEEVYDNTAYGNLDNQDALGIKPQYMKISSKSTPTAQKLGKLVNHYNETKGSKSSGKQVISKPQ